MSDTRRPVVVILGAGFGGLRCAKLLARSAVDVVLIDRTNYHLFQPLLYQVAAAYLDPGQIAQPVRAILRKQRNVRFLMAEARGVDFAARSVRTDHGDIPYDYLIIAVGSATAYYGLEDLQRFGFGLKSLGDAIGIRNHVLTCFERASLAARPEERRALLTFAVVGGGSAGIEMAGALGELIAHVLVKDFPGIGREECRVLLIEGTDRLLSASPQGTPRELGEIATRELRRRGTEVRFDARVVRYDGASLTFSRGLPLAARTVIWAAGVRGAPLAASLGVELGTLERIAVEPTLQLPGHAEVFAVGDVAHVEQGGASAPMVAPAAVQMAGAAVRNLLGLLAGRAPEPFVYRNPGTLATIGRNAAVAHVWGMRFSGFPAWAIWLVVHILRLIGFRNRAVVILSWALDYFFHERAVRVITGEAGVALRGGSPPEGLEGRRSL